MSPTRVLVVEDEGILAMLTQRELQGLGYDVPPPVATAEDAIEAALRLVPDVVLMDVQLRGAVDGIDAARTIRQSRDLPIIYVTAFSEDDRVQRAQGTEPYGYLVKPVDARELHATIETAVARHRAHLALREREARFRAIAESSPIPLVVTRLADGRILWVNDLAAERFGEPAAQIIGRSSAAYYEVPGSRAERAEELKRYGHSMGYEVLLRRRDGALTVNLASTTLGEYDGETVAYTGLVSIDERKQAEDALRERELQMRLALDAAQLGTWRHDFASGVLTLDALAQRHFGLDGAETTMDELFARTVAEDRPTIAATLEVQPAERPTPTTRRYFEARIRHPSGDVRWIAVHGQPRIPSTPGVPPRDAIGTTQDITERKRAEETRRRFLAGSPAVVYAMRWVDDAFRPVWVSENLEVLTGWTAAEGLLPGWWAANVHPDDWARAEKTTAAAIAATPVVEFRFRRKDGAWIWIRDARRSLAPDAGGVAELVGSWTDVTERVALEERLAQSQKMEAIGRLAGGVAHDFNNLLTVIAGNADLLASGLGPDDPRTELLREIGEAGAHAAGLTRQLLAFSRSQVLTPKVLEVASIVTPFEPMLRRIIGEDIVITTKHEAGVGTVRVDPVQLEQVVMNLAVNARDAMPGGGELRVETQAFEADLDFVRRHPGARPGPHARLVVADTGAGMSRAVLAHAFEPFFTTKGAGRGSGLGLATVFGIVKQSEGHIEVASTEGVGTRFDIYLPVVRADADVVVPRPAPASASTHGSETILLTEDEAAVRRVAAAALKKQGYRVLVAESGAGAVAIAERHEGPIDLLLTDMVMPGMPGVQLAQTLRARLPGLKVLLVSGYIDDALVRSGGLDASVSYLPKPFSLAALARKVRDVLDGAG